MVANEQGDLVRAIEAGACAGIPAPEQRIDTHMSHLFLCAGEVWKLKRSVRLPFVDFSTLAKREAACRAELAINRSFDCPLYVGVEPVTRTENGWRVGGTGPIVDWLVRMKRFAPGDQLDEVAEAGRLSRSLLIELSDRIAGMHARAKPNRLAGHSVDYRRILHELATTEAEGAEGRNLSIGEPAPYPVIEREIARLSPLIEARRDAGSVRRCHGDLHLRNICLYEGRPTPFDALEFDERLATTDVLYDLAFLLMDLVHVGQAPAANLVMNRYWDTANEGEKALQLMPFFTALRAAVLTAVRVGGGQIEQADKYRQLSLRLLKRPKPRLLIIGGLSGSGKSAVAQCVAPEIGGPLGARLLRSDVLRKRMIGLSPETPLAGDGVYTRRARARVYHELARHAADAIAAGASVIADATYTVSTTRDAICAVPGAEIQCFWLDAPLETRLSRVSSRKGDASDADVRIAMGQSEPRCLDDRWRRIDATRPLDEVVADILG